MNGCSFPNPPKRSSTKSLLFILNYNGTAMTCDLLRSLRRVSFPHPVWVVDNGSRRDETAAFEEALPGVVVKRIEENCGFAGGVNRAMKLATEEGFDYAYEINNDTLPKMIFSLLASRSWRDAAMWT